MSDPSPPPGAAAGWLSRNVIVLGVVSGFTDVASEMVIPLLPVFLTAVLGAGAFALGWIEGVADATTSLLKLLSGRWADRMGRNRPLVIGGYALSSLVRPLVALAGAPGHVLAVRVADRVGKGLRTPPRDALIAASVVPGQHGAAYGFHRAMDHAGAVLGPLAAAAFLAFWSQDLRLLFALTAIPGALAVLVLLLGVREAPAASPAAAEAAPSPASSPAPAEAATAAAPADEGATLRRFLLPLALFALGNSSDVFLLLKAGAERAPLTTLPLLWMGLHVVKALVSVTGGRLADRWGHRRTIALGWVIYALVYAGFAFAETQAAIWALFLVYGAYHGLTEGPEKALVAAIAPGGRRGAAFGWYHFTLGILALAASVLFGGLWELFGSRTAFLASAALALAATVLLFALRPRGAGA